MNVEYSKDIRYLEIGFEDDEDRMRFISILCLARQRVQSKATLDMIADLLKELGNGQETD